MATWVSLQSVWPSDQIQVGMGNNVNTAHKCTNTSFPGLASARPNPEVLRLHSLWLPCHVPTSTPNPSIPFFSGASTNSALSIPSLQHLAHLTYLTPLPPTDSSLQQDFPCRTQYTAHSFLPQADLTPCWDHQNLLSQCLFKQHPLFKAGLLASG